MKVLLLSKASLVTVLVLAATSAHAQSGLIARYLLNGNGSDAVGSNPGTVVGAVPTMDRFGQFNGAYNFNTNGGTARIEFSAPPPFTQANNWTVTAWVKPANFSHSGLAVYVGSDNGAASDGFGFGVNGNDAVAGFVPAVGGGFFSSGASFPGTTEWTHVIMTRTNGTIRFYVNGVLAPSTTTAAVSPPTDFTIGSQNGLRYFQGAVDDVRIYNRALVPAEIASVYSGNEGPCYPHAATAEPVLFNGFVVAATVTDGGCGYTNVPTVTIIGGGGSNATATATISNGVVTAVNITGAGCCYTNNPNIIISSPPFPTNVKIRVTKIGVTQHVMIGRRYVLEGSLDLLNWAAVGPAYTAQAEDVLTEVTVGTYQFFRTREVP